MSHTASASASQIVKSAAPKLIISWLVVALFQIMGHSWLSELTPIVATVCFIGLFGTIIMAAFGVVHEADELAHQLGEPYGTLILTLSIVSIEVILIAAVMLGPGDSATIGRDSIYAVMMIIMNLVTGICLLLGAMRYGEQEYNAPGAVQFIAMTLVLVGVALLLPNVIGAGGEFKPGQAITLSILTVIVYGAFIFFQMGRYRSHFMQPKPGCMMLPVSTSSKPNAAETETAPVAKGNNLVHSLVLVGLILPIVLLAHHLAVVIDYGVAVAGAPVAVGGVVIAIIVFTPETLTAFKAALNNETQRAINLCLGAFVSTVGLTIPAVLIVGLVTGKTVVLGISPAETILLALTLGLTTLTYLGHRTSAIFGLLHLMLFVVFGLVLFA